MKLELIKTIAILLIIGQVIIGIFLYLIIRWSAQLKTPKEIEYEIEEEIKFLEEYREKHGKK